MYEQFYGFIKKPFSISPDPNFIYLNSDYREALAVLQYGIAQRKGIVCLIGEVGTGKTMLINTLLKDLDRQVTPILLTCPELSYRELVEFVQAQLGIKLCSKNPTEQISALYKYLLAAKEQNRTVVLIIDEAQSLSIKMLEFLRLLSNLETSEEKLIQILLSGQPELKGKLNLPELRQFKQRVSISFQLGPLKPEEVPVYIAHRLKVSGYEEGLRLFSAEALESLQEYSTGIPRLINALCENALAIGYVLSKPRIDRIIVEEAARDLMLEKAKVSSQEEAASTDAPIVTLKTEPSTLPENKIRKKVHRKSFLRFLALPAAAAAIFWFVAVGWPLLKESPPKLWHEAFSQKAVQLFIDQNLEKIRTYFSVENTRGATQNSAEAGMKTATSPDPITRAADSPSVQKGVIPAVPFVSDKFPLPVESVRKGAVFLEQGEENRLSVSLPEPSDGKSGIRTISGEEKSFAAHDAFIGLKDPKPSIPSGELRAEGGEAGNLQVKKIYDFADPIADSESSLSAAPYPEVKKNPSVRIIRNGDTICKILIETYGILTPYIWGLVHLANPQIRDLNLVLAGWELSLPPLIHESRIWKNNNGIYRIYLNAAVDLYSAERLKTLIEREAEIEVYISFVQITSHIGVYLLQTGRFATQEAALAELRKLSKIPLIAKIVEERHEPNI